MNATLKQWVHDRFLVSVRGFRILEKFYEYLQQNPHLLREDGEKSLADVILDETVLAINEQQMEKEAQEFAEWALLNYFGCSDKHKIWWEDDFEKQYTAKELYQIFKQQKP